MRTLILIMNLRPIAVFGVTVVLPLLCARGASTNISSSLPPAAAKQGVTFATDIKPILDASCVDCHEGQRAKASLHLDTLEGVLAGSKGGKTKVVVPGNSATSKLVLAVVGTAGRVPAMPPARNSAGNSPLTTDQVGLIRAWIDQGAK
jgi:hypothetical protein